MALLDFQEALHEAIEYQTPAIPEHGGDPDRLKTAGRVLFDLISAQEMAAYEVADISLAIGRVVQRFYDEEPSNVATTRGRQRMRVASLIPYFQMHLEGVPEETIAVTAGWKIATVMNNRSQVYATLKVSAKTDRVGLRL